jgi:ribosomal protein S18 acetylase RimI-like enzyme
LFLIFESVALEGSSSGGTFFLAKQMITIREMKIEDIIQVSELMCSCYRWLDRENDFSDVQIAFLIAERGSVDRITTDSQSQTYLVACMDNLVLGVVAVNGNEIAKLFVDPAYHRQGIGTKLCNSAQQIITDSGYEDMIVGVMAHSAVGFYEKKGMSKYCEKVLDAGAFSDCKVPIMRKILINK